MAGTETPEYQVNVSQENLINQFAVQGEEDSRILTLHLVENVETQNALEQTEIRQKPLDLTGCTARLYVKKPDGSATFTDGSIVDTGQGGTQNTVTFTITQQTTAAAGNAHCTVAIFGQNGTELKATGITLDIAADDMEQTIVSTSEFVSLAEALGSVADSAAKATQAITDTQTAVGNANGVIAQISAQEQLVTSAESARQQNESVRQTSESSRTSAETARRDAELQRSRDESARQTSESGRAEAEVERANAESKRAVAETARVSAEQTRQTDESSRATAETERATAEDKRASDEKSRTDTEAARILAEKSRADEESKRMTAEQVRQAAEDKRVSNSQAMALAASTATEKSNAAADRANKATQATENIVQGNVGVVVDQRLLDKTNTAGGIAGYDVFDTLRKAAITSAAFGDQSITVKNNFLQMPEITTALDAQSPGMLLDASAAPVIVARLTKQMSEMADNLQSAISDIKIRLFSTSFKNPVGSLTNMDLTGVYNAVSHRLEVGNAGVFSFHALALPEENYAPSIVCGGIHNTAHGWHEAGAYGFDLTADSDALHANGQLLDHHIDAGGNIFTADWQMCCMTGIFDMIKGNLYAGAPGFRINSPSDAVLYGVWQNDKLAVTAHLFAAAYIDFAPVGITGVWNDTQQRVEN